MTDIPSDDKAAVEGILPPVKESTAQAIADALWHQYGCDCAFVICIIPRADVEMIETAEDQNNLERMPRVAVTKAACSDELGAQLMRNILAAYDRKVTATDPIGEPKGNG